MESTALWQIVRQAFPANLTAYILDLDPADLDGLRLDERRRAALEILGPLAQSVVDGVDGSGSQTVFGRLAAPLDGVTSSDVGLATHARILCGGSVPDISSDADPVERALLALVRDAFPLIFLADWPITHQDFGEAISSHKSWRAMIKAAYSDRSLRKMFPHNSEHPKDLESGMVSFEIIWSQIQLRSGSGTPLQLSRLPQMLTQYVFFMTSLLGVRSVEAAFVQARTALAAVRALARGESVNLPFLVTFSNIDLSPDVLEVQTSQGILRRFDEASVKGFQHFAKADPHQMTALLVGQYCEKILENRAGPIDASSHYSSFEEHWSEAARMVDKFRFSLLLAIDSGERPTPVPGLYMEINPLNSLMSAGVFRQSVRSDLKKFVIDQIHVEKILSWSSMVEDQHPTSMDIAMKRVVAAAASRFDAMDGLIDAVMVWENLFGDKQETMFKICASMSAILEPEDASARNQVFGRLKSLYNARSNIVHGATELAPQQAVENRNEALDYALRTIRQAYHVPGLLELASSAQRAAAVLLHGARPR